MCPELHIIASGSYLKQLLNIAHLTDSFKGTDVTFEQFPDRIQHLVQSSLSEGTRVRSEVFPVYQTKGELVCSTLTSTAEKDYSFTATD